MIKPTHLSKIIAIEDAYSMQPHRYRIGDFIEKSKVHRFQVLYSESLKPKYIVAIDENEYLIAQYPLRSMKIFYETKKKETDELPY